MLLIALFLILKRSGVIGADNRIKVITEKVIKRDITETVNASGKIFPVSEVKVSSDIPGEVTDLDVAEGESVKKGQVLAKIKSSNGMMSTTLTSPIDGIVSSLNVKKGERVTGNSMMAGTEIMRISDLSEMEVRVDVGENDITKVNVTDSAVIEVEAYNNRRFKGVVKQIANSNSSSSQNAFSAGVGDVTSYKVYISILPESYKDLTDSVNSKNFPFRPGMTATADIQTRTHRSRLSVPINAVTTRAKADSTENGYADSKDNDANAGKRNNPGDPEEVVFVVQAGATVKKVNVTTDIQDINYIEILSGLNEGDEVVAGPYDAVSKNLKDGAKIKIVTKKELFEKK